MVNIEQGKQLWDVWNHVASIKVKSSFVLKDEKAVEIKWAIKNA